MNNCGGLPFGIFICTLSLFDNYFNLILTSRELYVDGNNLEAEGVMAMLYALSESAVDESNERRELSENQEVVNLTASRSISETRCFTPVCVCIGYFITSLTKRCISSVAASCRAVGLIP